jgi:hypothetical protein
MARTAVFVALGLGSLPGTALGQDTTVPDLEFLEYLGSWQEADDEWEVVAEWNEETREPPDGDERRRVPDTDPKEEDDD